MAAYLARGPWLQETAWHTIKCSVRSEFELKYMFPTWELCGGKIHPQRLLEKYIHEPHVRGSICFHAYTRLLGRSRKSQQRRLQRHLFWQGRLPQVPPPLYLLPRLRHRTGRKNTEEHRMKEVTKAPSCPQHTSGQGLSLDPQHDKLNMRLKFKLEWPGHFQISECAGNWRVCWGYLWGRKRELEQRMFERNGWNRNVLLMFSELVPWRYRGNFLQQVDT